MCMQTNLVKLEEYRFFSFIFILVLVIGTMIQWAEIV